MEFFPALGLAVLGIFTTVILGGALAGVIAFGVVDGNLRLRIQRRVVQRLIDDPLRRLLADQVAHEDASEPKRWGEETIDALRQVAESRDGIARLLRLDPRRLYGLHYRQLCGQIANGVGVELRDDEDHRWDAPFQPVTAVLAVAEAVSNGDYRRMLVDIEHPQARKRALQFVDTIQIALADAVLASARWCATAVIVLMLAAILVPNFEALNVFADYRSPILRVFGGMTAVVAAALLLAVLAYAATIIAVITFRWVDRSASAR